MTFSPAASLLRTTCEYCLWRPHFNVSALAATSACVPRFPTRPASSLRLLRSVRLVCCLSERDFRVGRRKRAPTRKRSARTWQITAIGQRCLFELHCIAPLVAGNVMENRRTTASAMATGCNSTVRRFSVFNSVAVVCVALLIPLRCTSLVALASQRAAIGVCARAA